ncbi:hypothetical protein A0H81_11299 [Grifola frondosa]|uniref:F-box domain-containing protein n=1 Tax=Grifola frondosa TaxID=5627 RepID=A0A1C7LYD3_GRIFR|nr:hypothetical protein A0H81_11299 [Grifola frondosa]
MLRSLRMSATLPFGSNNRRISFLRLLEFVVQVFTSTHSYNVLYAIRCIIPEHASAFHEPALDVLWKEIDGLAPLVKCFPADAWAVERSWQTSPKRLNMTRPLLAQDWTVVLTYANRIKALSYDIYGGPNLDPNVLQALLVFRPTLILFPKLHKLHWRQGLSNLSAMITLIGPELKTLEVFMRSSSEDDIGVIKSTSAYIGARCPNLESVTFVDMFGITPPVLDVGNFIASSKCLQHFMCLDNITCSQSSLLALAKLENLLELRLRLPDGMCFPALMGFETFPALRHLTIRGHFRECLNFFEAMDLARLETLQIVVDSRRDHLNIRSLLTAIRFGPDHFRMTTINLHIRAEPSASMSLISSDDIRHYLSSAIYGRSLFSRRLSLVKGLCTRIWLLHGRTSSPYAFSCHQKLR